MCGRIWLRLQKICGHWLLALSVLAIPARAQLKVGDDFSSTLNGYLGIGYSGSWDNQGTGHGLYNSAAGQWAGYYYNPNFLSFAVRPYYNRNQDNGSFGSVLRDTGVDLSTNWFGGSHFPGTIAFSKAFTNGSQYGLPTTVGLSSDTSTRDFSISWSELVPDYPSLTATFSDSATSSTLLGETGTTDTASRTYSLLSNYKIDGWQLLGFLNHQHIGLTLPLFLSPDNSRTDSTNTSYGISAAHRLPFSGMFQADYNRSNYASDTETYRNHGNTDTADAIASFQPAEKFTIYGQVRYTGNLIGALQQSLVTSGAIPFTTSDETSHGLLLRTYGTYNLGHGFNLIGYGSRQTQTFAGTDYHNNQIGGTLTYNYARPLFGLLYFSFGMVNNATNDGGGNLGFVGNIALKRRFGEWQLDSDFSYSQNAQTIITSYTASTYSYGAMIRRDFGVDTHWNASYRGLQSGLTRFDGYGNRSDTFLTNFRRGRYALSGSYSQSHGTAVLSTTGVLTPTPVAPLISPNQVVYDAKAYGVGLGVVPIRRLIINVNWYRVRSHTLTAELSSPNDSERYYGQMEYRVRKLSFRAGYWRVHQSIGASSLLPVTDNTYYFNISRWFDLF